MKKIKQFNKKTIIIIPLVLVMVIPSILSIIAFFTNSNNYDSKTSQYEEITIDDIKSLVDDDVALKIIDIHENPEKYNEKTEVFDNIQFFEFEDGYSIGIEYYFESGDSLLFDLPANLDNVILPQDINSYDKVEVTGKIGTFIEEHGDHTHSIPIIYISSIKKVD